MKWKQLTTEEPATYALIFDKGDEVTAGMTEFAESAHLTAAGFTAVGAFSRVTLGYFDRERTDYRQIELNEQVEVLSLTGDISTRDNEPTVHAHVVVGKSDGTAHGGHVLDATVWPTLEVIVTSSPAHLRRSYDPEIKLALIDLGKET